MLLCEDNAQLNKKEFVGFLKNLGIDVKTNTKARGHQGIYFKNRIDVSKHLSDERAVEVLVHEFAHYIHNKIEPDMHKTGGTLECLFNTDDCSVIKEELLKVTDFMDRNSRLTKFIQMKTQISSQIKECQEEIQKKYPDFQRSKTFKPFDKYIKRSNAKHLLAYDRVRIVSPFLRKQTVLCIDNLAKDFPEMPYEFILYFRLRSCQRKQARVSRRINKLNKYYKKPSELFARFVECFFSNRVESVKMAPYTTNRFLELLHNNYYLELKDLYYRLNLN